jgi:hypothetical protein
MMIPLRFLLGWAATAAVVVTGSVAEPSGDSSAATGAVIVATEPVSATSTNAEPTEKEMREAIQRHLDNLNALMKPPPEPATGSRTRAPVYYSPYWGYYYDYWRHRGRDSEYEDWTEVAKRAAATARVQIDSFKKIHCTPDNGGFLCEYVAELQLRGSHPAAQQVMQTSGQRLKGFFYKGDKGWIFGEAPAETK